MNLLTLIVKTLIVLSKLKLVGFKTSVQLMIAKKRRTIKYKT